MAARRQKFLRIAGESLRYFVRRYINEGPKDPASAIGWILKKGILDREESSRKPER